MHAGYLAPSALPAPVVVQGKPAASRGEAASEESATAAGNAVDMGLKTVGTLDLGGSSLEVTFLPTSTPRQPATGRLLLLACREIQAVLSMHSCGPQTGLDTMV